MNLFEIVKYGVNCREAAERYGVEVNHCGMALCPFHNDRHPSLYVADDHYYCFACGEHGDVIDFVGRLFQLSPYDAAQKLAADFHLTPDKPPSAAALHAKRIRTEAQQLRENERLCFSVLSDYARVLRSWKVQYAPLTQDEPLHERFINAKKPSWAGLFRHAEAGAQRVPAFCAVCRQVLERKGVHAARRSPFRLPKSWSTSLAPKTPHSSSSRSCRSLQRDGHLLFLVQHPPQSRAAHAKLDRRLTLIAVDSAQGDLYQFTGHLLQSTICVKRRGLGHGLRRL